MEWLSLNKNKWKTQQDKKDDQNQKNSLYTGKCFLAYIGMLTTFTS
jgi:hypothetical protein